MRRLSIKSNIVLGALAALTLFSLIAVENNKVMVKQEWYSEKLTAAKIAQRAEKYLKERRLKEGIFIDVINDPNETALIGQEFTLITTDRGSIDSKLASTNPNYAAVVVDMLKEAGLKKNDMVAVAFTGSFPGLNISVLAALETLELKPIIITSVGASNWGANDPFFTWLDMEKVLYEAGIFHNRSIAASVGGGVDRGRGLSPDGRKLIKDAIERNQAQFINEEFLEHSIEKRIEIYDAAANKNSINAFINVGGGIASLGATINGKIIPSGLTKILAMKNYPVRGVIVQMAQRNIPIIHLLNIRNLANKYNLPMASVPLPEPGEGDIFIQLRYSVTLTAILTLLLGSCIAFVYFMEKKRHRLGEEVVPNIQTNR